MVTAVEQDRVNRQLMLLGAAGIIYKPFTHADFENSFRAALRPKPASRGENDTILSLAAGGLSKCMLKTTDAYSWAWELCGVKVSTGKISDAVGQTGYGQSAAAVQINLRNGSQFSAALLFRSEDAGFISGCFVNGPVYRTGGIKDLEEVLLLEIGNVILNALVNPLINALKKSAVPSVPMFIKGGPGSITAGLSACLDPELDCRIISASLAMRRDGRLARAGAVCVLPEELAAEIERPATGEAA